MKRLLLSGLLVVALAAPAIAGELTPIRIHPDGTFERVASLQAIAPPRTLLDYLRSPFALSEAIAAGFDTMISLDTVGVFDGVQCTSTGNYVGRSVPRCALNDSGVFYVPMLMSSAPAGAPSFTAAYQVQNHPSTADTNSGRHWCQRTSCAVVTTGTTAVGPATLTYGTASTLTDNTNTGCNANSKVCTGSASAAFTCTDNGTASGCATTACNNSLVYFKVETRATGCTATVVSSTMDYGTGRFVESN